MRKFLTIMVIMSFAVGVHAQDVVISEINYNSAPYWDVNDWLEFYNTTDFTVDMTGWVFKDSNETNEFLFPLHTFLDAGEFLVLVRDSVSFTNFFPTVTNWIGQMTFKLSNAGELIRLYDSSGAIVDSLTYDDQPPWPTEPDNQGPTLEKREPLLPGWDPASWYANTEPNYHGSPGQEGWLGILPEPIPGRYPEAFSLEPCYPNPFNPETQIIFNLPKAAEVVLSISDLQGRQVATLLEGWHTPGAYRLIYNASQLPSGTYVARFTAGDFSQSQRLVLIK